MTFSAWLSTWLANHPLKLPTSHDPVRYTAEVMEQVRRLSPTPVRVTASLWGMFDWPWPRVVFAIGAAIASVAMALTVVQTSRRQLAKHVVNETQLLAALDEPEVIEPIAGNAVDALAQDLELTDALTVAEFSTNDDHWLGQTLQLLEQLDEQERQLDPSGEDHRFNREEWLKPLAVLDETV